MSQTADFIEAIHQAPWQYVLTCTGGGSLAISELLRYPGASRSVLEASVPYASGALASWLRSHPEQACSAETARKMAMAAYQRARNWQAAHPQNRAAFHVEPSSIAGVAATCSLASNRPKRGSHRFHLAWQSADRTAVETVTLQKGVRSREEEEKHVGKWILNFLAKQSGVSSQLPVEIFPDEVIQPEFQQAPSAWQSLLAGTAQLAWTRRGLTGTLSRGPVRSTNRAILSGSFNPLHDGHREMAQLGEEWLGLPVEYELTICNAEKPPLDFLDLAQRVATPSAERTLWLTRAATFVEKARYFPGVTFLVGADTIKRIGQPRFYHDQPLLRDEALDKIATLGCRFLVFGRLDDRSFITIESLSLPPKLAALCDQVPESAFRNDLSSTKIRRSERESEQNLQ
ncbi:CinA domain-containing protein [Planctomycetales bacterium 10988]|nr:CinA domain-containing protein [Planctomycetales bacterium 10988]